MARGWPDWIEWTMFMSTHTNRANNNLPALGRMQLGQTFLLGSPPFLARPSSQECSFAHTHTQQLSLINSVAQWAQCTWPCLAKCDCDVCLLFEHCGEANFTREEELVRASKSKQLALKLVPCFPLLSRTHFGYIRATCSPLQ